MANDDDILGASFFCSRGYLERKVFKNIFPTLAYQLACRYPRFRDHLLKVIKRDPSVAHNSLISQLKDLLTAPLSATGVSCVVIIDVLDECVDDQPASAILSILGRFVGKLPLVKFFITGRPEPRIRSGFRLPLLEPSTQIFLLHEVDPASVGGDIRLYLTEKLTAIAKRRSGLNLPEAWPSDEEIAALVQKSSGLFIFASTVARFIESEHHEPGERLRLVVSRVDDTSHEGASGIDSLYSQVLRGAFSTVDENSVFVNLKRILSVVVLALNPLSRDGLVKLLDVGSAVISTTLRHLHSVLLIPTDGSKEIRVFHKSFPDFLQDPNRCPDPRFHTDPPTHHGAITLSCLGLVGKLEANPCALSPFVMNQGIPDIPQLLEGRLGRGLRYACEHWSTHLLFSSTSGEYRNRLIASTSLFFDHSVFPWMEVMSLEGHLEGVIHSMNNLLDWLGKVSCTHCVLYRRCRSLTVGRLKVGIADGPPLDVTTDCLRFTLRFFRPIQMSAQHIYHTALPLSPEASILRLSFFENHPSCEEGLTTLQVLPSNLSTIWGGILGTIRADPGRFTHVAVVGKSIAAVCEDNTVKVYDAVTGVLRLSLNVSRQVTKTEGSSDGYILFCAHQRSREITLWDMQTGGLIHTFTTGFEVSDIAVSLTGKYVASCSSNGVFKFWEMENRCGGSRSFGEPVVSLCWLEPEDQVALAFKETVVILEVTTERTLRTFPVGKSVRGIAFSVDQHRLAVWLTARIRSRIVVINLRTRSTLVSSPSLAHVSCFSFSGNGDQVVCATEAGHLLFLRVITSPISWRDHPSHLGTIHSICHLRNGHLAVGAKDFIQLLATESAQSPGADQDLDISHVYPFDNDGAICASSRDRGHVSLLDMETMKVLEGYRVGFGDFDSLSTPRILCSSIDSLNRITNFPNVPGAHVICSVSPRWVTHLPQPALFITLSPGGEEFITVAERVGGWGFHVVAAPSGRILFSSTYTGNPPRKIVFTSETEFYTEHEGEDCHKIARRVQETQRFLAQNLPIPTSEAHSRHHGFRTTFVLDSRWSDMIRKLSEESVIHPYELDENLEWVVDAKLRRVCWLPPGYVSGIENGHFFVGSSIVMAGKDGIVRKLIFREPLSDS